MILVPKRELILPLRMRQRIAGWYKLEARKLDGRIRPLTGWFPNLITNKGLDLLGLGDGHFVLGTCAVGTGNTAPAVTDTALVALVTSTTNAISRSQANQGSAPYYGALTTTWQFPTGAAAGNLAEVGVGSTATSLFSRALILDGGGAPTTITVLSNEALNVTYVAQMYPPTADVTGVIALGGSNYNYTLRAANVTASQWWGLPTDLAGYNGVGTTLSGGAYSTQVLSAITGTGPSGTEYGIDSDSRGTYVGGSYTNTGTFGWSINAGNAPGGIGSVMVNFGWGNDSGFMVGGAGSYQCSFAAVSGGGPIPKDNTKVLSLVFQVTWASGT
jgi:hypothetical protein